MEITLKDLQELGRLLGKAKSRSPMTEEEKENFFVIPEGATQYQDYKSFQVACLTLDKKKVHYQAGGNHPDVGLFWTIELQEVKDDNVNRGS